MKVMIVESHSLSEMLLQAVEEWKKTGRLPDGTEWRPEETDSYEK